MNKRIKVALAKAGLTLQSIAVAINRSPTLVSFILNGKHTGQEHRPTLAALLGLKESDIPRPPHKRQQSERSPHEKP